jgi:hypothetical protein
VWLGFFINLGSVRFGSVFQFQIYKTKTELNRSVFLNILIGYFYSSIFSIIFLVFFNLIKFFYFFTYP